MNRQTLHNQLHNRLEDLIEKHRELVQHEHSIPQEDMDLFLREIRVVYELALSLHQHNSLKNMEDLEVLVAERFKGAVGQQHAIPSKDEPQPELAAGPSAEPVPSTTEEVLIKAINEAEKSLSQATPVNKAATDLHGRFEKKPTIAGKFQEHSTVAAKIATSKAPSSRIAETLQRKPIRDLKTGIGINEKFSFIQQLFSGNAVEYHNAIDHLNTCDTVESAMEFIETNIRHKYNWQDHSGQVGQFIDLIERRFLA